MCVAGYFTCWMLCCVQHSGEFSPELSIETCPWMVLCLCSYKEA